MLKVIAAAATVAVVAGLTLAGAAHAAPKGGGWGGLTLNGTNPTGQTGIAGPVQVIGLVLPNGVAVSVR